MLTILSTILVVAVALEHIYILYLEMFAWTTARPTPSGDRADDGGGKIGVQRRKSLCKL